MNRRPRIFHVISDLDRYGAARSLRLLVASEQARAWDLHVAALEGSRQVCRQLARPHVGCEILQRRWRFDPIAAGRLASRLRAEAPDVIHAWDLPALAYATLARVGRKAKPVVATLSEVPEPGQISAGLLRRLSKSVERFVVGSQQLRQKLLQLRVEEQRVQVVPPGALPSSAGAEDAGREAFLSELRLPSETKLLAIVGPLVKQEPVDDAIWSFELVRTLHPEARLIIVGDGPSRQRLERFARLVSDPGSVQFLGYRSDVSAILQHVDVFWQQGEAEVPAAAVLEAMAAGVPVVASDSLAHRELIEENGSGFLVPAGSRADWCRMTDRLLRDAQLADRIGSAAAQRIAEKYTAEAMIAAYCELYEATVGSGQPLGQQPQ